MFTLLNRIRCIPAWIIYQNSPEKKMIDEDIVAFNATSFWDIMCRNACFRSVFYARCQKHPSILLKVAKAFLRQKRDLQIDVQDELGGGMNVYHGDSTIVYAKAIGRNFTVYQQVTLGRGKNINGNDSPIIGDNVTVYAGAIIVGGVRIGNQAKIGVMVVVKDVPDYATVVGAPVRIIEHRREKCNEREC